MDSIRRLVRGLSTAAAVVVLVAVVAACGSTPAAPAGTTSSTAATPTSAAGAVSSSAPSSTAPSSSAATGSSGGTTGAISSTGAPAPTSPGSTLFGSTTTRAPGARLTLTGTVEAGVEPSCLVLTDEKTGRRVTLSGGQPAVVKVGARISVTGRIRTDLMSYCQQGAIFEVATATTA